MTMLASEITSLTVVYSIVYSDVNQRKHQSSVSLAFVREIHRGPVNFPHKWPVTRKMFPFDDVIMASVATELSTHPCVSSCLWGHLSGLTAKVNAMWLLVVAGIMLSIKDKSGIVFREVGLPLPVCNFSIEKWHMCVNRFLWYLPQYI